jgi:hypothetical protein
MAEVTHKIIDIWDGETVYKGTEADCYRFLETANVHERWCEIYSIEEEINA